MNMLGVTERLTIMTSINVVKYVLYIDDNVNHTYSTMEFSSFRQAFKKTKVVCDRISPTIHKTLINDLLLVVDTKHKYNLRKKVTSMTPLNYIQHTRIKEKKYYFNVKGFIISNHLNDSMNEYIYKIFLLSKNNIVSCRIILKKVVEKISLIN